MTGRQALTYAGAVAVTVVLWAFGASWNSGMSTHSDRPIAVLASDARTAGAVLDRSVLGAGWRPFALEPRDPTDPTRQTYGIYGPCSRSWMLSDADVMAFAVHVLDNGHTDFGTYRWLHELIEVTSPDVASSAMRRMAVDATTCQRYAWYVLEQSMTFDVRLVSGPEVGETSLWWQESIDQVAGGDIRGYTCVITQTGGLLVKVCLGAYYDPPSVEETTVIVEAAVERVSATLSAAASDQPAP